MTPDESRSRLLELLQTRSLFRGSFTLASGTKSDIYFDCKLTTLDPEGAWLVGQLMHGLIRGQEKAGNERVDGVGGLTMGADPIALAVGMYSHSVGDQPALQVFSVRKTAKVHGQAKMVEGNFQSGQSVVVIDDVVTRGESTIAAIKAVENEGGRVAFVAVLLDRQEGGRQKIEALGHQVIALFTRAELLGQDAKSHQPAHCALA